LTNKKRHPLGSDVSVFKEDFFFEGQEDQCLSNHLFRQPRSFEIKLVTTWECNLRCSHCFVLHQLVKKDPRQIDVVRLSDFVHRYLEKYPSVKKGRIQFVGGEAALTARTNIEVIDSIEKMCLERGVDMKFHTNTNCYELNPDIKEYYSRLTEFTISVDGPKHLHDAQRKSISDKSSAFNNTIDNISELVAAGMREKMAVQAAVGDEGMSEENILSFYKTMLMVGVKYERISYAFSVPTKTYDPGEKYKKARRRPFPIPCCKYRWMGDFTICNDNKVYCDYFDISEKNMLGDLSDDMDIIAERHGRIIKTMPALNDPKCQSCPVIGLCWGNCCNLNGLCRPSELCDAEGLYNDAKAAASKGDLQDFMRRKNK
jgi:radical SAM protein with 4Fe4S-binding SPASM domain